MHHDTFKYAYSNSQTLIEIILNASISPCHPLLLLETVPHHSRESDMSAI